MSPGHLTLRVSINVLRIYDPGLYHCVKKPAMKEPVTASIAIDRCVTRTDGVLTPPGL